MLVILSVLIIVSSCQSEEPGAAMPTATSIAVKPTAVLTTVPATSAPSNQDSTPTPVPAAEISPTVPKSNLLAYDWDDRSPFIRGLIDDEAGILNDLRGASVYHMLLNIEDPTTANGQMTVRYTNQETVDLTEIYFHLFPDQLGGAIHISDVTVNGRETSPEYVSTALRIPLTAPLKPGQSVVIAMDFVTSVPQNESTKYNILAYDEEILALAHFYPMIATFDDSGWHIEPSPPHGDETYADMSYYIVQITAPAAQTLASSGIEINHTEEGSNQTITMAAGPMRDFYLVMSDRFDVVSTSIGDIQINSYAPSEFLAGAELALDVAANAVGSFNQRFGPYPYSELDVVSTPTLALGIEYPGIFANALRIYDIDDDSSSGTPNAILLESTTAHEAGHQWFYNLVGNDQLNEPWLDEALTQYATWTYFIDRYGEQNAQGYYNSLEGRWSQIDFTEIPIGLPADAYNGAEYGAIVYGRGPIFLNELAKTIGQEPFDQLMRDYVENYRWKIATAKDFQILAEEHCGCDLADLFNAWVYG